MNNSAPFRPAGILFLSACFTLAGGITSNAQSKHDAAPDRGPRPVVRGEPAAPPAPEAPAEKERAPRRPVQTDRALPERPTPSRPGPTDVDHPSRPELPAPSRKPSTERLPDTTRPVERPGGTDAPGLERAGPPLDVIDRQRVGDLFREEQIPDGVGRDIPGRGGPGVSPFERHGMPMPRERGMPQREKPSKDMGPAGAARQPPTGSPFDGRRGPGSVASGGSSSMWRDEIDRVEENLEIAKQIHFDVMVAGTRDASDSYRSDPYGQKHPDAPISLRGAEAQAEYLPALRANLRAAEEREREQREQETSSTGDPPPPPGQDEEDEGDAPGPAPRSDDDNGDDDDNGGGGGDNGQEDPDDNSQEDPADPDDDPETEEANGESEEEETETRPGDPDDWGTGEPPPDRFGIVGGPTTRPPTDPFADEEERESVHAPRPDLDVEEEAAARAGQLGDHREQGPDVSITLDDPLRDPPRDVEQGGP